jgi:hypothetical protein
MNRLRHAFDAGSKRRIIRGSQLNHKDGQARSARRADKAAIGFGVDFGLAAEQTA